ncbi:hypothetical protein J3E72DRAFT_380157 [Bipolaris maydis]|nr:hypothetical protein J3E72DRAFT_380157 [Bipolaris maydis]
MISTSGNKQSPPTKRATFHPTKSPDIYKKFEPYNEDTDSIEASDEEFSGETLENYRFMRPDFDTSTNIVSGDYVKRLGDEKDELQKKLDLEQLNNLKLQNEVKNLQRKISKLNSEMKKLKAELAPSGENIVVALMETVPLS